MQFILQHNGWSAHTELKDKFGEPWDWTDFDTGVLVAYSTPDPDRPGVVSWLDDLHKFLWKI